MNTIPRIDYNPGDTLLIPVRDGLSPTGQQDACEQVRSLVVAVYGKPINVLPMPSCFPVTLLSADQKPKANR